MKTGRKFKNGFTLVEIMVVVMILGVMLSYTTANVRNSYASSRVEQAASRLSFELQQARSYALSNNQTVSVDLDTATKEFTVWIDENGDDVRDSGEEEVVELSDSSSVSISSDWSSALYNSYGQFLTSETQTTITSKKTVFASSITSDTQSLLIRGSGAVIRQ